MCFCMAVYAVSIMLLEQTSTIIEKLAEAALAQIKAQKYYAGLSGTIFCIGLAHNKKDCRIACETVIG